MRLNIAGRIKYHHQDFQHHADYLDELSGGLKFRKLWKMQQTKEMITNVLFLIQPNSKAVQVIVIKSGMSKQLEWHSVEHITRPLQVCFLFMCLCETSQPPYGGT